MLRIKEEIKALTLDRKKVLVNQTLNEDAKSLKTVFLNDRIQQLEKIRFAKARDIVATISHIYSETVTKQAKPRDIIADL